MQQLVVEGSRSGVMQSAAKKAVQLERTGSDKLGLWLGAAFAEVSQDVSALLGRAKESPGDAPSGQRKNIKGEGHKAGKDSEDSGQR